MAKKDLQSNREVMNHLEFEKNRMEILKMSNKSPQYPQETELTAGGTRKQAWELELDEYRKRQRREKFYFIGSVCGILSLLLTLILNFGQIMNLFH